MTHKEFETLKPGDKIAFQLSGRDINGKITEVIELRNDPVPSIVYLDPRIGKACIAPIRSFRKI